MRNSALVLLLAACFLAPGTSAWGAPESLAVPEARPVQLDGVVRKAEWSAALALPLGKADSEIRVQQFRGTLMLALQSDRWWPPRSRLTLWLCPDGAQAGADGPGAVRLEYEPFEHNREHVMLYRKDAEGWKRLHDRVVVRHVLGAATSQFELAVPLRVLGLTTKARPALRACLQWARPGGRSLVWPQGLELTAAAGTVPPDLASAKRWGTLTGWGDPAAPGAFSKTEWDGWLARDREIRHKGAQAHHAVELLIEEWKKTKKRDSELVPEVLGALRWVRQHEHLTANDQLAMVTVLRYLNRHDHALGMLESLVDHPDDAGARRAYRERALLLQSMQRYEDAASDWEHLARVTGPPWNSAYTRAAKSAREHASEWAAEAQARAKDEQNTKLPRVALHTPHGVVELVLYADDVPDAVKHFLALVEKKFYDGTLFHRVHGEFLAQGGDPKSRDLGLEHAGSGSSSEQVPIEVNARHTFWRGAVGFARGMSDYNGSQFFLMTGPRPKLGEYTCFGHVVRGMDAVDRLEYGDKLIKVVVLKP